MIRPPVRYRFADLPNDFEGAVDQRESSEVVAVRLRKVRLFAIHACQARTIAELPVELLRLVEVGRTPVDLSEVPVRFGDRGPRGGGDPGGLESIGLALGLERSGKTMARVADLGGNELLEEVQSRILDGAPRRGAEAVERRERLVALSDVHLRPGKSDSVVEVVREEVEERPVRLDRSGPVFRGDRVLRGHHQALFATEPARQLEGTRGLGQRSLVEAECGERTRKLEMPEGEVFLRGDGLLECVPRSGDVVARTASETPAVRLCSGGRLGQGRAYGREFLRRQGGAAEHVSHRVAGLRGERGQVADGGVRIDVRRTRCRSCTGNADHAGAQVDLTAPVQLGHGDEHVVGVRYVSQLGQDDFRRRARRQRAPHGTSGDVARDDADSIAARELAGQQLGNRGHPRVGRGGRRARDDGDGRALAVGHERERQIVPGASELRPPDADASEDGEREPDPQRERTLGSQRVRPAGADRARRRRHRASYRHHGGERIDAHRGFESSHEGAAALEAIRRALAQRAAHDRVHRRAHLHVRAHRCRVFAEDLAHRDASAALQRPGQTADEQLPCDHAPRELVASPVERIAAQLFGGHVEGRAHHRAVRGHDGHDRHTGSDASRLRVVGRRRRARAHDRASDAEVQDLHDSVAPHHHVLGLDVAVDDAALVGGGECAGDREQPVQALSHRHRGVAHESPQRHAVHELHREERRPVHLTDVEDGDRVRVVDRRRRAGLAQESRGDVRSSRRRDDLQSHPAAQVLVASAVDLAHPSLAEQQLDSVPSERLAGTEGHRL